MLGWLVVISKVVCILAAVTLTPLLLARKWLSRKRDHLKDQQLAKFGRRK